MTPPTLAEVFLGLGKDQMWALQEIYKAGMSYEVIKIFCRPIEDRYTSRALRVLLSANLTDLESIKKFHDDGYAMNKTFHERLVLLRGCGASLASFISSRLAGKLS